MKQRIFIRLLPAAAILFCWFWWSASQQPTFYWLDSGIYTAAVAGIGIPYPPGFPAYVIPGIAFAKLPLGNIAFRLHLWAMLAAAGALVFLYKINLLVLHYRPESPTTSIVEPTKRKNALPAAQSKKAAAGAVPALPHRMPLSINPMPAPRPGPLQEASRKGAKPLSREPAPQSGPLRDQNDEMTFGLAGAIAVIVMGLSVSFWCQAINTEVYALHVCLTAALTYFLFKAWDALQRHEPKTMERSVRWAIIALGASFANHPMSISLMAPLGLWVLMTRAPLASQRPRSCHLLILAGLFCVTAILPYLYLPIMSLLNHDPDWGNPETLRRLLRVVTGIHHTGAATSYSWFGGEFQRRSYQALQLLYRQWLLPGTVLVLWGAIVLGRRSKRHAVILAAVAVGSYFLGTAYIQTKEFASWYLPVYLAGSVCLAVGLTSMQAAVEKLLRMRRQALLLSRLVIVALGALVIVVQLYANRSMPAHGAAYEARDYGRNMIERLAPRAIVFLTGDNPSSTVLALQIAERFRDDLVILHQNFLASEWYRQNLRDRKTIALPPEPTKPEEQWTAEDLTRYILELIQANSGREVYFLKPEKIGLLNRLPLAGRGMLYQLIQASDGQPPTPADPDLWQFHFANQDFFRTRYDDPQPIINDAFEELCTGFYRAYVFALIEFVHSQPELARTFAQRALEMVANLRQPAFFPADAYSALWVAGLSTQTDSPAAELLTTMISHRQDCFQAMLNNRWFDGVLSFAEVLAQKNPRDLEALEFKGIGLAGLKQYAQAEHIFLSLRERQPNNPNVYYNLGNIYDEQGKPGQARASYEEALRLNPRFELARKELARLNGQR